ncbi:glucans biosynthesis glucosyltransferase MdoH [Benzoatithermus flavus]|uniref:Glucans biosynthesis glucosyltransferase H n=1 Tax=Benzoatithermus flavus TaxID=3108223 RepID=A0ABU8XQY7_9PROT
MSAASSANPAVSDDALGPPWPTATARVRAYLEAAGLEHDTARDLAREIVARCAADKPAAAEEEAVLAALRAARLLLIQQTAREDGAEGEAAALAPRDQPLSIRRRAFRSVMDWRLATSRIRRLLPARAPQRVRRMAGGGDQALAPLTRSARNRRAAFGFLILATTVWGVATFVEILGTDGLSYLDITHTAIFTVLLLWLAQSFWTLAAGAAVLLARLLRTTPPAPPGSAPAGPLPRVAVIAPIYNEDTERVFAGVQAMWEDLQAQPGSGRVDLFVLSDTTDPDIWLAELDSWQRLRQEVPGGERIFYRRRLRNVKRKTGNIEDFVTRWGGAYGYMVVLDADSLMSGRAIMGLIERMDANPAVGLIQAPPKLVRGRTVFARMLQFAGELYGPLSASGISYWALGEGNYWGHNAIIRIVPFAELCGLPLLPGRAPLGGEILSHDFVEAALLRRGGWQVWIADDLGDSYEEPPPSLADFATRDRRWCQGNMQHIKVLFVRNLHWVSRLHLGIGIMSYLTSPLWLLFLLLSAAQAWELTYGRPVYFVEGWPFPTLPVSVSSEATLLLVVTLGLLFLPKLFGLFLALIDGPRRRALGGSLRLTLSALLETLLSALLAPIMMLFHTGFVLNILLGSAIEWQPQRRQMSGGLVAETVRRFGWVTVLGSAAAIATFVLTPTLFYWLIPVLAGLVLAIPLALWSSSERWGERLRALGLLRIVEETEPPPVMRRLEELLAHPEPVPADRFAEVVLHPGFNALHIAMLQAIGGQSATPSDALRPIERKAVYLGAAALSKPERRALLEHAGTMARLHLAAWLHWRSEHGLPWETDEPLPPAPRGWRPGQSDRPVSSAAA